MIFPEPKEGPADQKVLKIKVEGSYLMSLFDFYKKIVR